MYDWINGQNVKGNCCAPMLIIQVTD